jgi:predicted phosphodiesterase
MFRKFLQYLLKKPVTWLAETLSSAPKAAMVNRSLSRLLRAAQGARNKYCLKLPFDSTKDKFIIFSDQHKGIRDGVDDFRICEPNYLQALDHYFREGYHFISLGDSEELWKNTPAQVMGPANAKCFEAESAFLRARRYYRVFGNHDLEWKYVFQRNLFLRPVFGKDLKVYEGLLLKTSRDQKDYSIFLAHGHQGDQRSDGNKFSMWVVAAIWTPIQRFLQISLNTPANNFELKDRHNIMMYQWSARHSNLVFISGHTHKPVFASLDHIDKITGQLLQAREQNDPVAVQKLENELAVRQKKYPGKSEANTMAKPCYFNSGCCCFSDGDITGIEISGGMIRLVKWNELNGSSTKTILEEASLDNIFMHL